jgi:septum formation protein
MIRTVDPLILGSKSPRRQQLLRDSGFEFSVIDTGADETIPDHIQPDDAACYLAEKKAMSCRNGIEMNILITADTVVIVDHRILGKPASLAEAKSMLKLLSGRLHRVITGVCLAHRGKIDLFSETTYVTFSSIGDREIEVYLKMLDPRDRAGSYGIQDWIGMIGILRINGSYLNVIGLPVAQLYQRMKDLGLLI